MTFLSLLTFTMTMFVLVVIPGPGTFAISSKTMSGDLKSVSYIIFGMIIADILFLFLAIFGLSAVSSLLGDLFVLVKYGGSLFLLYLGYKLLTSKIQNEEVPEVKSESGKKNFLVGFAITFANPNVILFYASILPSLVDIEHVSLLDIAFISLCITFVISTVMYAYVYFALHAKKLFTSGDSKRNLNRVAGIVMIIASLVLLIK